MSRISRRSLLLLGVSALALTGCAAGDQIAANASDEPRGGIGGTGIVGVLTDFGSLIVNGKRIEIDADTQILGPLGALTEADLEIGQALSIEAATVGGTLIARRVLIADPLVGAVSEVDGDARRFVVNGVTAVMERDAGDLPEAGARIVVSGIWRENEVIVSRIAETVIEEDVISGVASRNEDKRLQIGSSRISPSILISAPPVGAFAIARGVYKDGRLHAQEIDSGRFTGAAGPLKVLSVEGYLEPIDVAPFYSLSGLGHSFDRDARLGAVANGRVLFEGPYTGTFSVATGAPLPDSVEERRKLFGAALSGAITPARVSTR